jgi:hypothetical protein
VNQTTVNLVVAGIVVAVLLYLLEQNTLLVALAIGGLGYLLFANNILGKA